MTRYTHTISFPYLLVFGFFSSSLWLSTHACTSPRPFYVYQLVSRAATVWGEFQGGKAASPTDKPGVNVAASPAWKRARQRTMLEKRQSLNSPIGIEQGPHANEIYAGKRAVRQVSVFVAPKVNGCVLEISKHFFVMQHLIRAKNNLWRFVIISWMKIVMVK